MDAAITTVTTAVDFAPVITGLGVVGGAIVLALITRRGIRMVFGLIG